jgi:glycerol-1-phosphate dehydrogenase [NAD(P)+]
MPDQVPVTLNDHAFESLAAALQAGSARQVLVIADANTYPAGGWQVESTLRAAGLSVTTKILAGQPGEGGMAQVFPGETIRVKPDETSIVQVLDALDGRAAALVAVGSGTITDITRFCAYQARLPFYSVPTAASVDAYTSYTAAITIGRVKKSILAKPACGVFARLPLVCTAPPRMAAAGFGDMAAKFTALADWKLAHLLVDEDCPEPVADWAGQAARLCMAQAASVGAGSPAGIAALLDGLFVSGHCMVAVHSSRPAAGAEHSLAHFWEMKHHLAHQTDALHGEKTGAASVVVAGLYQALRQLSRSEVLRRLDHFILPDPQAELSRVQAAYGPVGSLVISNQSSLLGTLRGKIDGIKERLAARWDEVLAIAETVPAPAELVSWLEAAGAPASPAAIQVNEEEIQLAIQNAMYIRDRLTILELNHILNLSGDHTCQPPL